MTTKLDRHHFPSFLTDMGKDDEQIYSDTRIGAWMQSEINGGMDGPDGTKRTHLTNFFDGTKEAFDPTARAVVQWTAFPKRVTDVWGQGNMPNSKYKLRWAIADSSRIYQDEYLEWSVARSARKADGTPILDPSPNPDSNGDFIADIDSIAFTCEGPEYWQFFTEQHPDKIAETYIACNDGLEGADPQQLDVDLFLTKDPKDFARSGVYNPCNSWNFTTTSGIIMHLIHPSNTLGAEIDIAAQGTVLRYEKSDPTKSVITNYNDLIRCSQYGNPHRNSDPEIGGKINDAIRSGLKITVEDPVALYMGKLNPKLFQLDYSGDKTGDFRPVPEGVFRQIRGDFDKGMGLRLHVSIPGIKGNNGKMLTVSDLNETKTGLYIRYAAQFADHILMSVTVNTMSAAVPEPEACPVKDKKIRMMAAAENMAFLGATSTAPRIRTRL